MPTDSLVEMTLTVVFLAVLFRQGFLKPLGVVLSWPMFAIVCCYRVELTDDRTGEPVSIWDHELPQDYFRPPQDLVDLVTYLHEVAGKTVSGTGVLAIPFDHVRIEVDAGRVVYR